MDSKNGQLQRRMHRAYVDLQVPAASVPIYLATVVFGLFSGSKVMFGILV